MEGSSHEDPPPTYKEAVGESVAFAPTGNKSLLIIQNKVLMPFFCLFSDPTAQYDVF